MDKLDSIAPNGRSVRTPNTVSAPVMVVVLRAHAPLVNALPILSHTATGLEHKFRFDVKRSRCQSHEMNRIFHCSFFSCHQVAVFKDYNLNRHYTTKHGDKYRNLSDEEHAREADALMVKLQTQQGLFTKLHTPRDAAVRTSFVISHKIARKTKAFSDGEFIKEYLLDSVALICPEKKAAFKAAFENVSLSRRTVTRRVEAIAGNLELQLKNRAADFDCFSLALDESCDVRDNAQLLIFLRGITADFQITEELASMQSIKGTTAGNDLFTEENESEHGDISYHSNVRWLSLGKVLKSVWDLRDQIQNFCGKKGHDIPELSEEDWVADLGFAVDVTALMNELNVKLQCKGLFVHEMYSAVTAFMRKLQLLSSQVKDNILTHLPTLKEATRSADHLHKYSSKLKALHGEFSRRFQDFKTLESEMHMVSSPFTCSVDNPPSDVQMELIDLQSDLLLVEHFRSVSLLDFYSSLKEENFPHLRRHAPRILVLFGSTYVCEQTFSVMKFNKSKHRSSITDEHLLAVLRLATSDIQPDFNALVQAQNRLDYSH
ncbi:general transcription factor II-I repeat domain-containing protein 2A-like [Diretmus argenteus]